MKSPETGSFNREPTPELPSVDRDTVLASLLNEELMGEFGIEVTEEDLAWLSEETYSDNDGEFLEWLVSLAAQNGVDHEEFLERLGIPLDYAVEQKQETE